MFSDQNLTTTTLRIALIGYTTIVLTGVAVVAVVQEKIQKKNHKITLIDNNQKFLKQLD